MSQFNAPAYDIERPGNVCAITGRTLNPGEAYIAALVEVDPDDPDTQARLAAGRPLTGAAALGMRRLDVSMEAWGEGKRPDRVFSFWKSVIPEPNKKKKLFVDDEVLMNLLRRLADTDQPQRVAFRFVLALILMRKKLLRYDGTEVRPRPREDDKTPGDEHWWLVTPKLDLSKGPLGKWSDSERMEVRDPHLDESQITQVTEQLSEILEAEL